MKFILTDTYRFWWPVTVRLPDPEKPGAIIEQTFEVEFLAMPKDRAKELDAAKAKLTTDEDREAHDRGMLTEILCNWRDVVAAGNKPVPFDAANLDTALQFSFFRVAIYGAYAEAMAGEEARTKN